MSDGSAGNGLILLLRITGVLGRGTLLLSISLWVLRRGLRIALRQIDRRLCVLLSRGLRGVLRVLLRRALNVGCAAGSSGICSCRRLGLLVKAAKVVFSACTGAAEWFTVGDFLDVVQRYTDPFVLRCVVPEERHTDIRVHTGIDCCCVKNLLKIEVYHRDWLLVGRGKYPASAALFAERLSV